MWYFNIVSRPLLANRQRVSAPCAGSTAFDPTMPSRKRSLREAESAPSEPEQRKEDSLIQTLRNSFYFANLYQWICIFGKVVKVDDNLDIAVRFWRKHGLRQRCKLVLTCKFRQDLETECLKHGSMALQEIGLSLLKHISSHRGLSYVP